MESRSAGRESSQPLACGWRPECTGACGLQGAPVHNYGQVSWSGQEESWMDWGQAEVATSGGRIESKVSAVLSA